MAVVDAFDAMTTNRAYRPPRSPPRPSRSSAPVPGAHFDPEVVSAFERAFSDLTVLPLPT